MDGSTTRATEADQAVKVGRSASGTPSSEQITRIGKGWAKASIRSTGPEAARASRPPISSSAIVSAVARSASMRRGVKAPATRLRSRAWPAGSWDRRLSWLDSPGWRNSAVTSSWARANQIVSATCSRPAVRKAGRTAGA